MIDVATLSVIRRWALREHLSLREIARRTGLSRNTIKKYLRAGEAEPRYAKRVSPSRLDPFAEKLAGWLMTISPNKVKPELRETVMAYQAECDDVLWQHWSGQHRKAETQAEKYWFTRRPHWRAIRSLVFDGLTYAQAGQRLGRSAGSVGRCVRRMVQVGLIDPVQFIRLRYLPHTAERLVAANKQMCLQWGVAP